MRPRFNEFSDDRMTAPKRPFFQIIDRLDVSVRARSHRFTL
jgi:hypothetical protein